MASPAAEVARLLQLLRRSAGEVDCDVSGGSMGAAIPDGSTVRIRLDGGAGAEAGSAVALLLAGDTLSVHRLVHRGRSARARGLVLTHGDGNVFCDAPQREADLLGTVVAYRGPGGTAWGPVPPPARHAIARRALTAAFEGALCAALEIDPRLANSLKNALVLVMTPVAWLRRPRGAADRRSTSRLVGAQPVVPR